MRRRRVTGDGVVPVREPLSMHGFRLFWIASTAGSAGLAISAIAVDVLVIEVLQASEAQVGLVRAAQFIPYLLVGLVAGSQVDRWRRRPVLIWSNLAQAGLLLAIPVLHVLGALTLPTTVLVLFLAGCCAVYTAAAEQSVVPDLLPRRALVAGNARLGQSMTVAQTLGPAVAGALVSVLTAPLTLVLSSLARVGGAVAVTRIRRPEPRPTAEREPMLRAIAHGLRFTYGHRVLGPLAISTHVWFVANAIAVTVFGLFVLRGLELSPTAYGAVLTATGLGSLAGALLATRFARWFGEGRVVILSRLLCGVGWAATAFAPADSSPVAVIGYLVACQAVIGFSMGAEEPSEMGLRQSVTPRAVLGRVSATYRSANRTAAVVGALTGGVLATALSVRATLLIVAGIFLVAVAVAWLSALRTTSVEQHP